MEKIYKRILSFIILPCLVAAFPFLVFADSNDSIPYDWYFKPTTDHSQPIVCPEADFIDKFNTYYLGSPDQKDLYLTFDAGYDNGFHAKILDTLKQKNVTAAFFVDGNFIKTNPDIVKRMASEGHLVCNHSLKHPDMTKLTDFENYKKQIVEWENLVSNLGIAPQKYFRFPGGRFSKLALEYNEKLGLKTVFWSFAYYDWDEKEQPDPSAALEKINSRLHNGAILLLHSTSKTNAQILSNLIDSSRMQGYTFKSLDAIEK